MLASVEDMEVGELGRAELCLGEHAFYHLYKEGMIAGLDVLVEGLLHHDLGGRYTLSAGIAGVREVLAVGPLVAGELHFVGVDDDYVVTALDVG